MLDGQGLHADQAQYAGLDRFKTVSFINGIHLEILPASAFGA